MGEGCGAPAFSDPQPSVLDGNKRAGWNAVWTFTEANAIGRLAAGFDVHAAEQLMLDVASGVLEDLALISACLRTFSG
jgi:prophage maintenance system killer protein